MVQQDSVALSNQQVPLRYFHELDGLRGASALIIVLYHAHFWGLTGAGQAAMEMFFSLSAFLITDRLLREHELTGRFNLVRFYQRRIRRLWPNLLAWLISLNILSLVVAFPGADQSLRWSIAVLTSSMNWVEITHGTAGLYSIAWSLAIEEQFYLVWPILLLILIKARFLEDRRIWYAFGGLIIFSVLTRLVLCFDDSVSVVRVRNGTDTRLLGFVCGSIAALLLNRWHTLPLLVRQGLLKRQVLYVLLGIMCLSVFLVKDYVKSVFLTTWLIFPVLSSLMILIFAVSVTLERKQSKTSLTSVLSSQSAKWLGKISYSLYLWHGLPLWIIETTLKEMSLPPLISRLLLISVGTGTSLGIAYLFWFFVEARCYKRNLDSVEIGVV
jgi:peptidoglycan/LPS O-acetylase OafA/YrhL